MESQALLLSLVVIAGVVVAAFLSVVAVKTVVDSCCCFCFCGDALSVGGVGVLGECLVVLYILQALALNLNSFP